MLRPYLFPVVLAVLAASTLPSSAADNLRLRDGVSFFHDLDKGFPIIADKMDDCQLAADHPTLVFFGAAGDLNTNRQAKRVVDLYRKYNKDHVKFIVIDVDHPANKEAKQLIRSFYSGYIPTEVIFGNSGQPVWNHTGEAEIGIMSGQLEKLL